MSTTNTKKKLWYLTHSPKIDYVSELYQPIKSSALWDGNEIVLPYDTQDTPINSYKVIDSADLILAEVSYSSTGQGIELGWAHAKGKPIWCFYKAGSKPSRSLKFVAEEIYEYQEISQVLAVLQKKS